MALHRPIPARAGEPDQWCKPGVCRNCGKRGWLTRRGAGHCLACDYLAEADPAEFERRHQQSVKSAESRPGESPSATADTK